jgi:hypothetical protein
MPLKINPAYLRKIGIRDPNHINLSKTTVENRKPLEGLGITDMNNMHINIDLIPRREPIDYRTSHQRSTSNTSKSSATSGLQRPSVPYMPSIRQSGPPFTPPVCKSTPASLKGSTEEADTDITPTVDDYFWDPETVDWTSYVPMSQQRSGSWSDGSAGPLRILASGSTSRLGSYSQTSLSLTSPVFSNKSRGPNASMDAQSPSTRASLDKALGFIRRNDSSLDPEDRAAAVRDARRKHKETQSAKARKQKLEADKAREKHAGKGSKPGDHDASRPASVAESQGPYFPDYVREGGGAATGISYGIGSDTGDDVFDPYQQQVEEAQWEKSGFGAAPGGKKSRSAMGRWMLFVTWFQTRVYKMKRSLKRII